MRRRREPLWPAWICLVLIFLLCSALQAHDEGLRPAELRFNSDKTFKIVQFTDTQDDHILDPRTAVLIKAVLDDQRPDLVVFTGDIVVGGPQTAGEVMAAVEQLVGPVDALKIPWLITFGNHDEDHSTKTGMNAEALLVLYRSYPHNINGPSPENVAGWGNMHVLVLSSRGGEPMFNIWALDSGRDAPLDISGQRVKADVLPGHTQPLTWAWVKTSQVMWYYRTSEALEKARGRKIPSLMFFHIPLPEFRAMYENRERHDVRGERNEEECQGAFNGGLFTALLERGDVKGVFVGHDHVNDYSGDYFGIVLGYSASAGFGTYGLEGAWPHRLRGARVFVLREEDPARFETFMVYARDYGIQ